MKENKYDDKHFSNNIAKCLARKKAYKQLVNGMNLKASP